MLKVVVTRRASKALAQIPRRDRETLLGKIEAFASAPYSAHSWAKPLRGQTMIRIRQGDWRAIVEVDRDADALVVLDIAHRREAYR